MNMNELIRADALLYRPDITISDLQACPSLSSQEREIILASLNYPKIKTMDLLKEVPGQDNLPKEKRKIYEHILIEIVGKAIWEVGITERSMSQEEQTLFIQVSVEEIKAEFGHLSIEDVRIAFKKGARKHYGEFYGMNIATVNQWLNGYIDESKPSALMKLAFVKPDVKKEYTEEEKKQQFEYWLNNVLREFSNYRQTGTYAFYDFNNRFYNYCTELGIEVASNRKKMLLYELAVLQLREQYHPSRAKGHGQRIDYKSIYDGLLQVDELNKGYKDKIILRAKKLAVEHFFKRLVKSGKDLKVIIQEAQTQKNTP